MSMIGFREVCVLIVFALLYTGFMVFHTMGAVRADAYSEVTKVLVDFEENQEEWLQRYLTICNRAEELDYKYVEERFFLSDYGSTQLILQMEELVDKEFTEFVEDGSFILKANPTELKRVLLALDLKCPVVVRNLDSWNVFEWEAVRE